MVRFIISTVALFCISCSVVVMTNAWPKLLNQRVHFVSLFEGTAHPGWDGSGCLGSTLQSGSRYSCSACFLQICVCSGTSSHSMVSPTLSVELLTSWNLSHKFPHRHAQRFVSMVMLRSITPARLTSACSFHHNVTLPMRRIKVHWRTVAFASSVSNNENRPWRLTSH